MGCPVWRTLRDFGVSGAIGPAEAEGWLYALYHSSESGGGCSDQNRVGSCTRSYRHVSRSIPERVPAQNIPSLALQSSSSFGIAACPFTRSSGRTTSSGSRKCAASILFILTRTRHPISHLSTARVSHPDPTHVNMWSRWVWNTLLIASSHRIYRLSD